MMMTGVGQRFELTVEQEEVPAFHPSHGTPNAMKSRTLVVRVGTATARFEQTDYGHPGRFNPWSPRGIDASLQSRNDALLRLCDSVSALL
jgi:hypothetical protein